MRRLDLCRLCRQHRAPTGQGGCAIARAKEIVGLQQLPAASLLFAAGARPCIPTIAGFAGDDADFSVAFRCAGEEGSPTHWMELLIEGLTFDLIGLAPGPAADDPPCVRGALSEYFEPVRMEGVMLRAAPHVAGGAAMLPAVRALARLTARLASLPGTAAVAWHPARSWNAPERFRAEILRWLEGGRFPALSLAALGSTPDGGMHSEGLALFCGQELRLEPEIAEDRVTAAKTVRMLLAWLPDHAPLDQAEEVAGPDGVRLRLEPSTNGRFVRVWKA